MSILRTIVIFFAGYLIGHLFGDAFLAGWIAAAITVTVNQICDEVFT